MTTQPYQATEERKHLTTGGPGTKQEKTGLIPHRGTGIPHASEQLSLCATTTEKPAALQDRPEALK